MSVASSSSSAPKRNVRDVGHLGDFTATPRVLLLALLAVPIGLVSAGVSWVLLRLIGLITNLVFYQRVETTIVAPGAQDHHPLVILFAPVLGGLVVGLMARYGSERIRGHGMPETIEAVLMGGSKVKPRVALLKPISAAVSIGTGGPFGAEGPIIMTGGAFGSLFAQFLRLTADERKTLLVAGSAAGMAATFNAPLASIVLAVELLLFEWRPRSFFPVASAVSVAAIARIPLLGSAPLFASTAAMHVSGSAYVFCLVSGGVSAVLAIVATGLVYTSEDAFHRLPIHWMWWPALGGLIIGVGGLVVPQALGVGYDVIDAELTGSIGLGLAAGVLLVKTLIWSLSLGSGTSGGVMAPMFLIGGALGAVESSVFPHVGPGFWAVVALAGVLGGVMRCPVTGIVFAMELVGRMDILLPLVIAASSAFAFSVLVLKRSILTEKIARRGYHLSREYDVDPLEVVFVSEVMDTDVTQIDQDASVAEALEGIQPLDGDSSAWRQRLYPVVDADGRLSGVVTRGALLEARTEDPDAGLASVMTPNPIMTHGDQPLRYVAELMATHEINRIPVVDRDDNRYVVGMVSLTLLLWGRRRDQLEARERERILRMRFVRPHWTRWH